MGDSYRSADSLPSLGDITYKDKFSDGHYSVQNMVNKVDLIESELCNFGILNIYYCKLARWKNVRRYNTIKWIPSVQAQPQWW